MKKKKRQQLRQSCIINTEHKNLTFTKLLHTNDFFCAAHDKNALVGMGKLSHALDFNLLMHKTRGLTSLSLLQHLRF